MQLFRRQSTAINEFLHLDLKELGLRSFVAFIQLEELSLSSLVRNYLYSMVTNYINEFENGDGIACYLLNRHVLETAQTGSVDLNTFLMQMTLLTNIGDRITFPDKMLDQLVYLKDGFINTQEGGVTFIRILRALRMLQWRRDDQFKCVLHNPEVDHEVIICHLCEGISMLTNLLELGNVYVFKMSTSRALSFCVSVLVEMAKNNPTMLQYLSIQHVTCADTVTNVSTVFGFLNVIYTINDFSAVLVLSQLLALMLTEVDPASIRSEVRRTCQRSTRERLATKIIDSLKNENEDVDVTRLRLHVLEILIEYNSDLFYDILALKQIEEVSDLPICKTLSDVAKNTKRSLYERATSISLLRKIRVTDVIALKNIIHFFADTAGTTEKVGELYHGAQLLTFLNTAYYHKVKETPTEGDVENTPLGDRRRQRPQQETIETVIRGATAYLHNFLSTYSDAFADITAVEGGEPELPQIQNQTRANNTSTAEIARKKSNTLSTIFARQSLPKSCRTPTPSFPQRS
ncbi:hypothetical protein ADEAN_000063800 [Angomonas deanei]|uniref:Uncharacterized protein n=1 Tax=Angomonas deanei TaxID=59799 RepID=A0A7G2C1V2_9TRYP|nr:hypothetical protein ADEAN_000063800 [Angomonas deanei]